jgi:hypothetical protein
MADEPESRSPIEAPQSDGPAWTVLGAASHQKADAFLDKQTILVELQAKELAHELRLRHWSLRVRHVSDVLKLGFELAVGFIVLAVAVGVGAMIWRAAHAEGLVIRSFEVPAALAARGLSGQVIANKLLDRLTVMQGQTDSSRAASSFANDWTNDIKVEIPDTGISLGDAVRFLDGWLGHEMHLSGELYETPSGIALTVRMDNDPGQTFEGKPDDLNGVIARAAEAVFARAQPYRYENFLFGQRRFVEGEAAGHALAATGSPSEAAWAYLGLGINESYRDNTVTARQYFEAAKKANPNFPNSYASLSVMERIQSHEEDELGDLRRGRALLEGPGAREWNPASIASALTSYDGIEAQLQGDFARSLADNVESPGSGGAAFVAYRSVVLAVGMHDVIAARRFVAMFDATRTGPDILPQALAAHGQFLIETEDWQGAIVQFDAAARGLQRIEAETKGWRSAVYLLRYVALPYEALADAKLGKFDRAEAILKTLPADCDVCARAHGEVEAMRKNWISATGWFRLVSDRSHDIPFADSEWGGMLLQKGDLSGAIAHFEIAHERGPHFADPQEMWGEALMQQNRSDLALAKFEEANKYAPNWGRLHLKWGEALLYAGRRDEATKQFSLAASLYLSVADKVALMKLSTHQN